MTEITERQKLILETVIDEYIRRASPISSDFLKTECNFEVSPATIRLDLVELTKSGFLQQPYISGGRVPTDKGYRFFVDGLFEEKKLGTEGEKVSREFYSIFEEVNDILKLSHELVKSLASFSSNLSIARLQDFDIFWREGWEEVVQAPEFHDIEYLKRFMEVVNDFERNIDKVDLGETKKVRVYIGEELPFKRKEFSIVVGEGTFSKKRKKKGIFAILGPRRMDFKKNIQLINSLIETIEDFNEYGKRKGKEKKETSSP